MAPLAEPAELAVYLQRDVDQPVAVQALDIASAIIRRNVGWSITAETGVVIKTEGDGTNILWLPTLQLSGVTSVVEEGVTLTFGDHYRWTTYGRLRRISGIWSRQEQSIEVTIDHGFATSPLDAKGVCLSVAGRLYSNPEGLRQWSVGGVSQTVAGDGADASIALTEAEESQLGGLRLISV